MKEHFSLESPNSTVRLTAIRESDCERLRQWKNAHRFAFFFQDLITPEQQAQWFENYKTRSNDYMFTVVVNAAPIGCMGFRLIDERADIYNVIRGEPKFGGKGSMSQAMRLLCSFIAADFTHDIGAQVLATNPARAWYRKNGFREISTYETHVQVSLDLAEFHPCPFEKLFDAQ